jgi:tetratricopeptide (TPR) repeat protein
MNARPVFLFAFILSAGTAGAQSAGLPAFPPDFPQQDSRIWSLREKGLIATLAARSLAASPDSADTFELLMRAGRHADSLAVLQRIAANRPDDLPRALRLAPELASQLARSDVGEHAAAMRELMPSLKALVAQRPREEAAQAARHLLSVESQLTRPASGVYAQRMQALLQEYAGTEAARLMEPDAIAERPEDIQKRLQALDAFAREHPGTAAAAKALYHRGYHLAHNGMSAGMEPARGDPVNRLLLVHEIVKDLEGGPYPRGEWTDKARDFIVGFSSYQPTYAPGSLDRVIAVYEEFARSHFALDDRGATSWGVGYLISQKIADLYALKGDRIAGVERLIAEIAGDAAKAPAARYLLAEFYLLLRDAQTADERSTRIAKARETLAVLHAESEGLYQRKALARLAILEFGEREYASAAKHLSEYIARYADSPWAWVAALRLGQAHAAVGNWAAAAAAYQSAAARFSSIPPGRVLAHAYAARALEALGRFDEALAEHERALTRWDRDYGETYSLYFTRPARPEERFSIAKDDVEVIRTALAARVAGLKTTLRVPGAALLERGRWLFAQARLDDAATALERVLKEHPRSALAGDARVLLHRVRLTRALERADAAELERLSREPFDFWVAAAKMTSAALASKQGDSKSADALMTEAFSAWQTHQASVMPSAAPSALELDVLEIRNVMFRPRGDGLFTGTNWELQSLKPPPTPFFMMRQSVDVKPPDGEVVKVRIDRALPDFPNVLFFDAEQLAFFDLLLARAGGTEKREPTSVMQVPNQPAGGSVALLALLTKFFPARPGHWGGWMFETFPTITRIEFTGAERTKAVVRFTVGYEGASAIFEKQNGVWTFKEMKNRWIT